jgi:hypothetical protein
MVGEPSAAGELQLKSARAFFAAGDTSRAVSALRAAMEFSFHQKSFGAPFDPSGAETARQQTFRTEQRALRSAVLLEAGQISSQLGGVKPSLVTVKTNPPKQQVRYWAATETGVVAQSITSNDTLRLPPMMYFFTRERSGGRRDTLPAMCARNCIVAFDSSTP